ncbi:MAG: outer membrane protein assembly factor BamA [Alphaproteobacteria bacterium]|nr:outer membrane protein assembly factor BamA [Alphaproteobacteria bacterium]
MPGLLALVLGAGIALAGFLFSSPALAQGTIEAIKIEGSQRIEPETVRSYLSVKPGDPYDAEKVNASLKSLFATGLFADVTLRREGNTLVVRVVENPIVNRVAFEGNRKIESKNLEPEISLRARVVYTRTKVQNDTKRILDLYRRSGRFAATVEPKIIQLDQNRVDVVYEINEGAVTAVSSIRFIGNRAFNDSKLRSAIQTKETAWYRIFSTDDNYDPDRLTFDRELLRRYYLREGYADFRVVSAVAELTPDRSSFFITFTVDEGERYKFGVVDLSTQFKNLDLNALRGSVIATEGNWYNADLIEKTITKLTDTVGDLGFAFVDIQPTIDRDRDKKVINVTFDIQEGPRVFVERIDIVGNYRTLDRVIRREFRLVEGDAFSTAQLRRSRQRIQNLGFFKKVDVSNVPGTDPDKTVVQVEVEEQSTGEISVGAGFSSSEGALADLSVRERNLLGRGQDLRTKFRVSQKTTEFDVGFTEPYFLDRDLSAGIDLFRVTRDNTDTSSYELKAIGGGFRLGYSITENLRHTTRYVLRQDEITNIDADASRFIREQEGTSITSLVGYTLFYDRLDNRQDPTDGYYLSFSQDFAGLGGDVRYLKNKVGGGTYWPIPVWDKWILSLTGEAGVMAGLGERVRINDRFFLGGDNFKGFATGGVGPRDTLTKDALGGRRFYVGTAELTFPLGFPDELGVSGKAFTTVGSAWDASEDGEANVADPKTPRASIGVGAAWKSPFGPIRIDLAKAFVKQDFDQTQFFHFSFGTRF